MTQKSRHHARVGQRWDHNDTQYCVGCGLYHYRGDCTDVYFNDASNWDDGKEG